MPVYDLVPDASGSTFDSAGLTTVGGGLADVLGDASDATYAYGGDGAWFQCDFTDPVAPSGRLCSLGYLLRLQAPGYAHLEPVLYVDTGHGYVAQALGAITPGTEWTDYGRLAYNGLNPDDVPLSLGADPVANGLMLECTVRTAEVQIARARLQPYYLGAVSCSTPSAPTGTVTSTQMPTLSVPLSLVVESWQLPASGGTFLCGGDVEFQVFKSSDAVGSTPPAGVTPVWKGTVRFSESTVGTRNPTISATPTTPLANGQYVVYARASRDLMSGSQLYWGTWVKSAVWTQDLALPAEPTLTLSSDDALQKVGITANVAATTGYDSSTCQVDVQRQLAGGSWREVRGMTALAIATGTDVDLGDDREADRGAGNTYRARASMVLTADGVRRYSVWAEETVDGPAVTGWNLKAVEDPDSNWLGAEQIGDAQEDDQGQTAVLQPLDRDRPVVVSVVAGGFSGTLQVVAEGAERIAAAEALRGYRGLVLLETGFGEARYVALTKVSRVRSGSASDPVATYSLTYTEVDCDLAEDAI